MTLDMTSLVTGSRVYDDLLLSECVKLVKGVTLKFSLGSGHIARLKGTSNRRPGLKAMLASAVYPLLTSQPRPDRFSWRADEPDLTHKL